MAYAALLELLAGLGGCGATPAMAPPTPKARTVEIEVRAAADLNPNRDGRPSPVVVRVLVLRGTGPFTAARFEGLSNSADPTLGGSVLGEERRLVRPGEASTIPIRIDAEAGYLGVLAEYSNLEGAQWRDVMSAPQKRLLDLVSRKPLVLDVGRDRVRLSTRD